MRVMIVTPHLNLGNGGGSERQIINLAKGLIQRNCEVVLLLTDKKGDLISELPNEVDIVFSIPGHLNFLSRTLAIYKAAKAKRPDILYSRLWTTKGVTVVVGKLLGIKTVLAEVNNLREKLRLHPLIFRGAVRFAKILCYKMADCVVSISDEGRHGIAAMLGVDASTIHNGLDIDRIVEKSKEKVVHHWFDDNIPIAVAVGRLKPQKGYKYLVETVSIVNETRSMRLLIIGGGQLKNQLMEQAESLGVKDKIDLVGPMRNPHKYTVKCDLCVCSSIFEGFGLVIAEALALGMPIISTDYKYGADEIIEDGKSGILVPVGQPAKMADAILRLIENKALTAEMGKEAKKRARHFSVATMTAKYMNLFDSILRDQRH